MENYQDRKYITPQEHSFVDMHKLKDDRAIARLHLTAESGLLLPAHLLQPRTLSTAAAGCDSTFGLGRRIYLRDCHFLVDRPLTVSRPL